MEKDQKSKSSLRERMVSQTTSPLKFFALAIFVCNAVFGLGTALFAKDYFIYTLHTFLGIVFAFVVMGLWTPRSFYSPEQLVKLAELESKLNGKESILPASRPLIPSLMIMAMAVLYGAYQINS